MILAVTARGEKGYSGHAARGSATMTNALDSSSSEHNGLERASQDDQIKPK